MPKPYESYIEKIESRYNGDHDLPSSDQPLVTWTDMELLNIIKAMSKRIDVLENRYETHSHDSSGAMSWGRD